MKPYSNFRILLLALVISFGVNAQTYKLNNEASDLKIDGTSNIHDWTIEAKNTGGTFTAEFNADKLEDISKLEFTVIAESLMSGKSAMDKNTYKALNTDKHKQITYKLKDVKSIDMVSANTYKVKTIGTLEIAGTKKDINLDFSLTTGSNQIVINGEYKLNMTKYGVEAPTAMFGTIKTGEEVTVKFETQFNK